MQSKMLRRPMWSSATTSLAAGLRAYYMAMGALANSGDDGSNQSLDSLIRTGATPPEGFAASSNASYSFLLLRTGESIARRR
jgi:hypothetical protein